MPDELQDAEPLQRRYGLGPPLAEVSGPRGVSAAVCLAHADAAPWLVVVSRDHSGHSEITAAPISESFGTCLTDDVLVAGGIAAHVGALIACEVDGIEQRVKPSPDRAWTAIFTPVAAQSRLTVRELGADAEVVEVADIDIGPDPTEPPRSFIQASRARLRRMHSGRFRCGAATY